VVYKAVTFEKQETIDIAEEKGQVTEGVYVGKREVNFGSKEDGSPDIRIVVDMQGPLGAEDKFAFWAPTSVRQALPQIPPGSKVRLTYNGMEKNPRTGRRFKSFTIEADTDGTSSLDQIPA
jgi:hypothetical protein